MTAANIITLARQNVQAPVSTSSMALPFNTLDQRPPQRQAATKALQYFSSAFAPLVSLDNASDRCLEDSRAHETGHANAMSRKLVLRDIDSDSSDDGLFVDDEGDDEVRMEKKAPLGRKTGERRLMRKWRKDKRVGVKGRRKRRQQRMDRVGGKGILDRENIDQGAKQLGSGEQLVGTGERGFEWDKRTSVIDLDAVTAGARNDIVILVD
ncbi:MAG: hypothetical protein Q9225_002045 [Loekoesia sp. 1 TL-2023]